MTAAVESPQWVSDRLDGVKGMLIHQMKWPDDMRVEHVREQKRLVHDFWVCTPEYEENGKPISIYRLTVQHPDSCECQI